MKLYNVILVLFCMLCSTTIFAQKKVKDKENKSIRIPAEPSKKKKDSSLVKIKIAPKLEKEEEKKSSGDSKKEEKKFVIKESEKPFSMTDEDGLKSPGEIFEKRWAKEFEEDGIIRTMSDQYLGEHKIDAEFVNIVCRDFGAEDGDLVRIYVNREVMYDRIRLSNTYRRVKINLVKGKNVIEIEALNEGDVSPNTGQFLIFDDFENLISSKEWNLLKGVKAMIVFYNQEIMIKEKITETTTSEPNENSNN